MKKYYIWFFIFISILIMGGLIKPGYVFTIDMAFGPNYPQEIFQQHVLGNGSNLEVTGITHLATVLYATITYLLGFLLPAWIIQKIYFILALAISGITAFRFIPSINTFGRYFAGLLYMINPFIYVRFLSGSLLFLFSYALLPLTVKAFVDLFNEPTIKRVIKAGLLLVLIFPAEHFLLLAMGVIFTFYVFCLFKNSAKQRLTVAFFGALLVFGIVESPWIYSILSGSAAISQTTHQISAYDLQLFSTVKSSNVLLNVTSMYGFWRENYFDPRLSLHGWQGLFAFIICMAFCGFFCGFKTKIGAYVKAMGLIAVISTWLAIGTSSEITAGVYTFLYEHVPFFNGMREPQKFAATLVLAYAFLGGIGVSYIVNKITTIKAYIRLKNGLFIVIALIIVAVPIVYTYPMLFGAKGQISNVHYPQDYYETDEYLNADKGDFYVLLLPWHNYLNISWVGRNVANPGEWFFSKQVIRGDNLEIANLDTQSLNPVSGYVDKMLQKKQTLVNAGDILSPLNIKYIILAKESDWEDYYFLNKQKDLELVRDSTNLKVFRNLAYTDTPPDVSKKAELLGLDASAVIAIENQLEYHEKGSKAWIGYLFSSLLFLVLLGYLIRDRICFPAPG